MKPIRTADSNTTLKLPGGTDENDLPATRAMLTNDREGADPVAGWITLWMPDEAEAARLDAGAAVELILTGTVHPPVLVRVTDAVIPERELIDRGHVDRALGHLYGALLEHVERHEATRYADELTLPSPEAFADLWTKSVDATKTDRTDATDILLPGD